MKRLLFVCLTVFVCSASRLPAAWRELPTDAVLRDAVSANFAQGQWVVGTAKGRIFVSQNSTDWVAVRMPIRAKKSRVKRRRYGPEHSAGY
jgi:glutamine amidotransferase PdxT